MFTHRILSAASVATALLIGGCSGDMAVNSVVSASPEVYRDCDRLAMKVLLASYEKAGENQGRLIGFSSNTGSPAKGAIDNSVVLFGAVRKGDFWISQGKVLNYGLNYYIDDNGKPSVYNQANSSSKKPEDKFLNQWEFYAASNLDDSGKDNRQTVKTGDSLTCDISFLAEGSVEAGRYIISEDDGSIYWKKE